MIYPFKKTVFNCEQATLLSLKRDEGRITLTERARLSYHLLYCDVCRQFIKQSHLINQIGKGIGETLFQSPPFSLSTETKKSIQARIDNELGK